jgi:hypothetical protein
VAVQFRAKAGRKGADQWHTDKVKINAFNFHKGNCSRMGGVTQKKPGTNCLA